MKGAYICSNNNVRLKKLDRLLFFSFLPPFVVTFFIALFVLMMQYLWVYIDDIIGKGADFFMVMEFVFYLSISLVPWALPLGILISSVMLLGNLAERYELASMKSAGVSLLRVMLPLIVFSGLVATFSYTCSNYLIPIANLKFKSRLYDLRKQKPTLSLEQGVFNDDFQGYVIRIGDKSRDGQTIKDVLIYENNNSQTRYNQTMAESGQMFTTPDKQFMIMNLKNGKQYQEPVPSSQEAQIGQTKRDQFPFVRIKFREWRKVFDLREFDLSRTDESLFKGNQAMLSTSLLIDAIDSIQRRVEQKSVDYKIGLVSNFAPLDSVRLIMVPGKPIPKNLELKHDPRYQQQYHWDTLKPIKESSDLIGKVERHEAKQIVARAIASTKTIIEQAKGTITSIERTREAKTKFIFELNSKFTWAFVCIIFLFIGAPMGAIVRKGGFGYPILVAIIFFMLFIILTILCKKLSESQTLPAVLATWLPCLLLAPIGIWLTIKSMNDAALMNLDVWEMKAKKLLQRFKLAK